MLRVSHCKYCLIQGFYLKGLFTLQKYQANIVAGLLEIVNTLLLFFLYIVCKLSLVMGHVSKTQVGDGEQSQGLWF